MLTSISPVGEQARGQRWAVTATAYLLGSVAGGATIGVLLGALGAPAAVRLPSEAAVGILALLAVLGLALDAGHFGRLPSRHRQVNERWLTEFRGWVYGLGFGYQLGLGVVTIVPASITYVVLAAATLSGSWTRGLLIGLVFGTVRAVPLLATRSTRSPEALRDRMRRLAGVAVPAAHGTRIAQGLVAGAALVAALGPWDLGG